MGEIYDTGRAVRLEIVPPRWDDEIGVTEKEIEAGKWAAVVAKHQENISTTKRKNS